MKYIKPWPFLGSMKKSFLRKMPMVEEMQLLYHQFPNAKLTGLHHMNRPVLMIRDPEMIKNICVKNFNHFTDHTTIITEDIEPLFGKNLVSLKGKKWKEMRSILSPAFTSSKLKNMFVLISECGRQMTDYFLKEAKNDGGIITVEITDVFTRYANDVIATCAFGIKCNSFEDKTNEFYTAGQELSVFSFSTTIKLLGFALIPKTMKTFKFTLFSEYLRNFFLNLIKNTIVIRENHNIIRPDMIHLLMEAKKGNLKHERIFDEMEKILIKSYSLTDEDITAQVILFFLAGFKTSSTLMCFLAHELAVNPDIQRRLREEIKQECQVEGKLEIKYENIVKMTYFDMVISECLRKWPPTTVIERLSSNKYVLQDGKKTVRLSKDQSVWIPVYCLHRDPKYFPDPERFNPERFSEENERNINPFTYLPFGVGPRNCIGSRFALLEVKALFTHLLLNFDIVVVEKTQVPLQLTRKRFALAPEGGFWLGLKPRY